MITPQQRLTLIQVATEHGHLFSLAELAEQVGISKQRVAKILESEGITKARKMGTMHACKAPGCTNKFNGTRKYSGAGRALYCTKHRRKTK